MDTLRAALSDPLLALFVLSLGALLGGVGGRRLDRLMERRRVRALVDELHDRIDGVEQRLARRDGRAGAAVKDAGALLPPGLQQQFAQFARSLGGGGPRAVPDEVEGNRRARQIFERDARGKKPEETG